MVGKDDELTVEEKEAVTQTVVKEENESDEKHQERVDAAIADKQKEKSETRYEKRVRTKQENINRLHAEEKATEERIAKLQAKEKEASSGAGEETTDDIIVIGEKKWYTNAALRRMVTAGELTQDEYDDYRDRRVAAQAKAGATEGANKSAKETKIKETMVADAVEVREQHPWLDTKHADFDPQDDRYLLFKEIWGEAYRANPKGLTLAAKRTLQILKKEEKTLSPEAREKKRKELAVESPGKAEVKLDDVTLTGDEKELAWDIYKELSHAEAEKKALNAKKRRLSGIKEGGR